MIGAAAVREAPAERSASPSSWYEANRRYLYAALDVLKCQLRASVRGGSSARSGDDEPARDLARAEQACERALAAVGGQATVHVLCDLFGLSEFERDVLLLAAGTRLVPGFGADVLEKDGGRPLVPSFELAFRAFAAPHWAALTPTAPLRRLNLIELERPENPVQSPIRIDERILYFLLGLPTLDVRLASLIEPVFEDAVAQPLAYVRLAERVAAVWSVGGERSSVQPRPIVQLCGPDPDGKRAIACAGSGAAGLRLYAMRAGSFQCEPSQRALLAQLVDRELALSGAALLLVVEDDDEESRAVRALLSLLRMPVLISRRQPLTQLARPDVRLDLEPLEAEDQRRLWRACLDEQQLDAPDAALDAVIGHFRLGPTAIRATTTALVAEAAEEPGPALWNICRRRGRSRLSGLAERVQSGAGWDDLVLPDAQKQMLEQIALHLAHKTRVREQWGFGKRGGRGLGLAALFSGDSGTGKTLAAEVIANQVQLDLWRVDLSRLLDKYIGETEKNLGRIFDAAEESGAVLLFDEADALFAKRTEVKDSVDRFTNVEVSYLLQRTEAYDGLAILTTNLRSAIDTAFLRRLRFVVPFPFPKLEQRVQIWSRAFPKSAPTLGVDMHRLAQLNISGGNIRNIALNAAFIAAHEAIPIGMGHLLRAARNEYAKLERTVADSEIAGWL